MITPCMRTLRTLLRQKKEDWNLTEADIEAVMHLMEVDRVTELLGPPPPAASAASAPSAAPAASTSSSAYAASAASPASEYCHLFLYAKRMKTCSSPGSSASWTAGDVCPTSTMRLSRASLSPAFSSQVGRRMQRKKSVLHWDVSSLSRPFA